MSVPAALAKVCAFSILSAASADKYAVDYGIFFGSDSAAVAACDLSTLVLGVGTGVASTFDEPLTQCEPGPPPISYPLTGGQFSDAFVLEYAPATSLISIRNCAVVNSGCYDASMRCKSAAQECPVVATAAIGDCVIIPNAICTLNGAQGTLSSSTCSSCVRSNAAIKLEAIYPLASTSIAAAMIFARDDWEGANASTCSGPPSSPSGQTSKCSYDRISARYRRTFCSNGRLTVREYSDGTCAGLGTVIDDKFLPYHGTSCAFIPAWGLGIREGCLDWQPPSPQPRPSASASPTAGDTVNPPSSQPTVGTTVAVTAAVAASLAVLSVSAAASGSSAASHITQSPSTPWRQLVRLLLKCLSAKVDEEEDSDEGAGEDDGGTSGAADASITTTGKLDSAKNPLSTGAHADSDAPAVGDPSGSSSVAPTSTEEDVKPGDPGSAVEESGEDQAEEETEEGDADEEAGESRSRRQRQRIFAPLRPGAIRKEPSLSDISLVVWLLFYVAQVLDQLVSFAKSFSPVPLEDIPFLSVVQSFFVWRVVTSYVKLRLRAAGVRVRGKQLLLNVSLWSYARVHMGQALLQLITLGCSNFIAELVGWGSGTAYDFAQSHVDAWLDAHLCWYTGGSGKGSVRGPLSAHLRPMPLGPVDLKQEQFLFFRAGSSMTAQWRAKLARWSTCRTCGDRGFKATLADYEEQLASMRLGGLVPRIRPRTVKGLRASFEKLNPMLGLASFEISIEKRLQLVRVKSVAAAAGARA